jgi:hypothetical protein
MALRKINIRKDKGKRKEVKGERSGSPAYKAG